MATSFRAELTAADIELVPQQPSPLTVRVTNTSNIIDGYHARVLGLDPAWVSAPAPLSLFPAESGELQLAIQVPGSFPAGVHPVAVQVSSQVDSTQTVTLPARLTVASVVDTDVRLEPSVVKGGSRADLSVVLTNDSNLDVDFTLSASDPERRVRARFRPTHVHVPAGEHRKARMAVKAQRPFLGAPSSRMVTVSATSHGQDVQATATFIQRPRVPNGAMALMVIVSLLALWAALLTPLVNRIANHKGASGNLNDAALNATTAAANAGTGPPANGIAGRVRIQPAGTALAGATLGAFVADNPNAAAASAATGPDGGYRISGLQPGKYRIKMTAKGFPDKWYPSVTSFAAATDVEVTNGKTTGGIDLGLNGLPGSLSGTVVVPPAPTVAGGTATTVPTADASGVVVTLQPAVAAAPAVPTVAPAATTGSGGSGGGGPPAPVTGSGSAMGATATSLRLIVAQQPAAAPGGNEPQTRISDKSGAFTFDNVPTPASYQLTFRRAGFGEQSITIALTPGETRALEPITMTTTAVGGSITGTVTDGTKPVGGAQVVATNGNVTFKATTLTEGAIGTYHLGPLPSPASFTLSFTADGFDTTSVPVVLTAGQSASGVNATLRRATSIVTGTVIGPKGPVAGATVTVSNGVTTRTAVTTDNPPGTYRIEGVPAGVLSVRASFGGFSDQAVQVTATPATPVQVDLALIPGKGAIIGKVLSAPQGGTPTAVVGTVGVAATGAGNANTSAGADGSYALTNLAPGAYTLTFSSTGFAPTTIKVTVNADQNVTKDVTIVPEGGSLEGTIVGPTLSTPAGGPLLGVQVDAVGPGTGSTTTTVDGRWKLSNLPGGGVYQLTFRRTGYKPGQQLVALGPGQSGQVGQSTLAPASGTITGQVVEGTAPIGGINIKLTPNVGNAPAQQQVSSDQGPFRFEDIATPATYTLTLTGLGLEPLSVSVALGPGEARDLGPLGVRHLSRTISGTVRGPVTSTSFQPLSGVLVSIASAGVQARTDDQGRFRLDPVPSGVTYQLSLTATGYEPKTVQAPLLAGQDLNLNNLTLLASPGSITGLATGPSGGIVASATLASTVNCPKCGAAVDAAAGAPFLFEGLETPGTYTLTVRSAGFTPNTQTFFLRAGEDRQLGTIALTAIPGSLGGTVVDPTKKPIPNVSVTLTGAGAPANAQTSTGGNGHFQYNNLPPGTYTLSFAPALPFLPKPVTVPVGPDQAQDISVVLVANNVTVSGAVDFRVPFGAPGNCIAAGALGQAGGVTVTLTLVASDLTFQQTAITSFTGGFTFTDVTSPGHYQISFTAPAAPTRVLAFDIQPGANANVGVIHTPAGSCP